MSDTMKGGRAGSPTSAPFRGSLVKPQDLLRELKDVCTAISMLALHGAGRIKLDAKEFDDCFTYVCQFLEKYNNTKYRCAVPKEE